MKKMLLHKHLQTKLNELEEDWNTMSEKTFLNQVEKLELADDKLQKGAAAAKEKLERKSSLQRDDKSHGKNSIRADHDKKSGNKKRQNTTSQGTQRFKELCKAAGVPDEICRNHTTNRCHKKEICQK